MVNIHKLIAAISPDVYCDPEVRKEVKRIVKTKGYLEAAEKAKPTSSGEVFNYDEAKKDPLSNWGLKSPSEEHDLIYDSATDGLERTYFWILDYLNKMFKSVDKITDNFISSPGSSHFAELQGRASQMQQESSRTLGNIHTVIKTIMGMIYDLKEFQLKIDPYNKYKSKNPREKGEGLLSLKSVWMDNVDIKRGQGSINAMTAGQLDFTTLRDAFMSANSVKGIDKIDLNERVKKILKQRLSEFFVWVKESEKSLRQRYEIERHYLKTQVATLKLYVRWVKPYLKAASNLEQNAPSSSALVNVFNTIILELSLMAKNEYKPKEDDELPNFIKNAPARTYHPIVFIEFNFRGIPQKVGQRGEWAFGGRTEIKFKSYALNDQELKVLKEQLDKDDLGEAMKLIEGATTDSLGAMQEDIEEFINEDKVPEERKKEKTSEDTNPFTSLFSFLKSKKKDKKNEDLSRGIRSDNSYEKTIRSQAILDSRQKCFLIFDIYKKAHAMPSHYSLYEPV